VDGLSNLYLPQFSKALPTKQGETILKSPDLTRVFEDILGAVEGLRSKGDGGATGKVVLIIDSLDLLLATAGKDANPVELGDMVMDLREVPTYLATSVRIWDGS
jgi:hypothetical protein